MMQNDKPLYDEIEKSIKDKDVGTILDEIDPKTLRNIYEDDIIAAYLALASDERMRTPRIICGGQFETYLHHIDCRTPWRAYGHKKYVWYDKKAHAPVIIVPKYKTRKITNSQVAALKMHQFRYSIKNAIDCLNVDKFVMSGHSFGGYLTISMSTDKRFERGVAAHPAIMGSILANTPRLKQLAEEKKLQRGEYILERIVRAIIRNEFGFLKEFARGLDLEELKTFGNWSKLSIIGGYIDPERAIGITKYTGALMSRLSELDGTCTTNDGFINWDEKIMEELVNLGATYVPVENVDHFYAESKNCQILTNRLLKRR